MREFDKRAFLILAVQVCYKYTLCSGCKVGGVFYLKTACFCAILYITLFLVYKERKRYDLRYERPARYV